MNTTNFCWALHQLTSGARVNRKGWVEKGLYLELQVPDENSANTRPYIYIVDKTGDRVPWVASQIDLLSGDWQWVAATP
jgi:hypothetical protein